MRTTHTLISFVPGTMARATGIARAVQWARGVTVCLLLGLSGVFAAVFVQTPIMALKLVSERLFWRVITPALRTSLLYCASLCHFGTGYRIKMTAATPETGKMLPEESALIIMNHRSEVDWISYFEWSYFMAPVAGYTKIVLKVRYLCCMCVGVRSRGCERCYGSACLRW